MTEERCQVCQRVLVPRPDWYVLPEPDRQALLPTHARREGQGLCSRHYHHARRKFGVKGMRGANEYPGDWYQDGLIRRPTMVRCPE